MDYLVYDAEGRLVATSNNLDQAIISAKLCVHTSDHATIYYDGDEDIDFEPIRITRGFIQ